MEVDKKEIMVLLDAILSVIVVIGFFYLILIKLRQKYPKIGNPLGEFFGAGMLNNNQKVKGEIKQQVWTDNRQMI